MNIDLETIGYFLYMEEQEQKEARSRSNSEEEEEEQEGIITNESISIII